MQMEKNDSLDMQEKAALAADVAQMLTARAGKDHLQILQMVVCLLAGRCYRIVFSE